jgi:CheY-like chemotaxis protein
MPLRIAVAEDDAVNRKVFVRLLEALGHEVPISVSNGHDLVDQCRATEVDLVFADFHLPEMDGLAAAEHLADEGISIVIISGHPDVENIRVDYEPIEAVLRKPVTIQELRDAIHNVIAGVCNGRKRLNLGS